MTPKAENSRNRSGRVDCPGDPNPAEIHSKVLSQLRKITSIISRHSHQLTVGTGLTVPQLLCLRHLLNHGPLTPGVLASYLFTSKATITGILDRLESRGFLRRERNDPDRRKICVILTPEGEKLARETIWPLQEQFAHNLNSLSERQCHEIRDALSLIADMMEPDSEYLMEKEEKENKTDVSD